jgi:hypothetical protein
MEQDRDVQSTNTDSEAEQDRMSLYCNTVKSVSGRLMDVSQPKTVQKSFTDSVVGITHRHTNLFLIKQISRHSNGSLLTAVITSKNMTAVSWLG